MKTSTRPVFFVTYSIAALLLAGLAIVWFGHPGVARANPASYVVSSTTATSSLTFMTAGTATTTEYFDTGASSTLAPNSMAVFLTEFTGSSTASTEQIAFEYAYDNGSINCKTTPTACEWFADDISYPSATTTQSIIPLATTRIFSLPFASSTTGGAAGSGNGRITRIISVPTPTRYVRAIITLPATSLNGAVWSRFIGQRESQ